MRTFKKAGSYNETINRGRTVLIALLVLGFLGTATSLFFKTVVHGDELRAKAEQNQLHDTEIRPTRGRIYDSNMELLAESANVMKVVCWPHRFLSIEDEKERTRIMKAISNDLAPLIDVPAETILSKFKLTHLGSLTLKSQAEKPVSDKVLVYLYGDKGDPDTKEDDIPRTVYTYKNAENEEIKFYPTNVIGQDPDTKRYYPKGSFASTLLGFTGTDDVGRAGLEYQYDKELTGIPGRKTTAKNAQGNDMAAAYDSYTDPVQGHSLVLTLDATIQRFLERELKQTLYDTQANATYGIVMEIATGAVLAMSSMPNYDLNNPRRITDTRIVDKIAGIKTIQDVTDEKVLAEIARIKDPAKKLEAQLEAVKNFKQKTQEDAINNQWKNHSIANMYYPGSVFKCITAAMALEEKTWGMSQRYTDTGSIKISNRTYHCHKRTGHGNQDFTDALVNSCNPYFVSVGQSVGVQKFSDYFEGFGFTERTGFSEFAETKPRPGVTYYSRNSMSIVDLGSGSFGQSLQVTPLQMITAISAIANGGKLMQPYIVERELDENGNTVKKNDPTVKRQVISKETADKVTGMMLEVVNVGTGKNGYIPGYRVAGKTGTSQKMVTGEQDGKYISSFVCFAPADDPKIAILITVDEPVGAYGGSVVAAPVAGRIMEDSLSYLNVPRQYTKDELDLYRNKVPSVEDKSVGDAEKTLKAANLESKIIGGGEKVLTQVPAKGEYLHKNGIVLLYTTKASLAKKTKVPDFSNMTLNEAKAAAAKAGLNLKYAASFITTRTGVPRAFDQDLNKGLVVEQGRDVTVYFRNLVSNEDYTPFFVD
ncbi:MAG: penicillin-binding transpeptidase domain-containing protein [Oscillospiraceae bacterium]|nr:penicillin-binding transpeptidase domain-containing protein [Oscillospiraceae bacterium]